MPGAPLAPDAVSQPGEAVACCDAATSRTGIKPPGRSVPSRPSRTWRRHVDGRLWIDVMPDCDFANANAACLRLSDNP